MDELASCKQGGKEIATREEVVTIAQSCGLGSAGIALDEEMSACLSFLHELGVVTWVNEQGLADIVVLVRHSLLSLSLSDTCSCLRLCC